MEVMSLIAIGIAGVIVLTGLYKIITSITFSKTESRYEYVMVEDEYGNKYEKVVDKNNKGEREWQWQSLS